MSLRANSRKIKINNQNGPNDSLLEDTNVNLNLEKMAISGNRIIEPLLQEERLGKNILSSFSIYKHSN